MINEQYVGQIEVFYENGNPKVTLFYKNGSLMEVNSYFDKDGNKLDKGTLKNGNGTLKEYDENGKLLNTKIYENGMYIREKS